MKCEIDGSIYIASYKIIYNNQDHISDDFSLSKSVFYLIAHFIVLFIWAFTTESCFYIQYREYCVYNTLC